MEKWSKKTGKEVWKEEMAALREIFCMRRVQRVFTRMVVLHQWRSKLSTRAT